MNPVKYDLDRGYPLKALSWKEPYGSLMLPPFCKIETRIWNSTYRGLVLICTSKLPYKLDQVINISGEQQMLRILDVLDKNKIKTPLGSAIAIGRLIDSRPMKPGNEEEDKCFVQYQSMLYSHVYIDVTPIVPFPWKGSQGWRTVPKSIINQIKFL